MIWSVGVVWKKEYSSYIKLLTTKSWLDLHHIIICLQILSIEHFSQPSTFIWCLTTVLFFTCHLCLQASYRTTSSVCRRASCCLRWRLWTTCSHGGGCCSCWPSPAWRCCPAPSSAASVRTASNWTSHHRTGSTRRRRSSDLFWELFSLARRWNVFKVMTLQKQTADASVKVSFIFSGAT